MSAQKLKRIRSKTGATLRSAHFMCLSILKKTNKHAWTFERFRDVETFCFGRVFLPCYRTAKATLSVWWFLTSIHVQKNKQQQLVFSHALSKKKRSYVVLIVSPVSVSSLRFAATRSREFLRESVRWSVAFTLKRKFCIKIYIFKNHWIIFPGRRSTPTRQSGPGLVRPAEDDRKEREWKKVKLLL